MSEHEPPEPSQPSDSGEGPPPSQLEDFDLDEVDVKDLLRAALRPPEEDDDKLQRGVQKQIREASEGRFYADGWSTAKSPKQTFLVTSLLMLLVLVLAWLMLGPIAFEVTSP